MPDLVFELGCEELPASFVRRAYEQLEAEVTTRLRDAALSFDSSTSLGTPRRLILGIQGLPDRQPDQTKEARGPALRAAYDDAGLPTKALEGFCRGQGVDLAELRKEGDYVWVTKTVPGRPTAEILAEVVPDAVRALTFDKSMRWGAGRLRFARPIRWMLCVFDGQNVPFEVEGVVSGDTSRGHRFEHPEPFRARSLPDLIEKLRARRVEPDATVRRTRIVDGARAVADGDPEMSEALIDENVFLTEWPEPTQGEFLPDYLGLPEPVLVTAMAKHERFFPVRDAGGQLTNRFVSVRNGGDEPTVRKGNAWVLSARFNDAKFFYDEDRRRTMADFLDATNGMSFQESLGTVRMRADRLRTLAGTFAEATLLGTESIAEARQAGLYAKADLSTGLVSELASLQGVVGGEYAAREGMPDAVTHAIATQYDPAQNIPPTERRHYVALSLVVVDNLDKLVGYLGLGLAPSGSSDPYGLRRAATTLIEVAWAWPAPLPSYAEFIAPVLDQYAAQKVTLGPVAADEHLRELFRSRYEALLHDARHDVRLAAIEGGADLLDPGLIRFRAEAMGVAAEDTAFIQAATRPINIVAAAEKKGIDVDSSVGTDALDSPAGLALDEVLTTVAAEAECAVAAREAGRLVTALRTLQAPIDAFFDATMVMVDDPAVRGARLGMLARVAGLLLRAGDFTSIVVDG